MTDIETWYAKGDWFDVCSCNLPCPCEFAQPPTDNHCDGVLAYHINEGSYGQTPLDGLSVVIVSEFDGNLWTTKEPIVSMGIFLDERGSPEQRQALETIFSGAAGGWPAVYAELVDSVRGIEVAPIEFELEESLANWHVRVGSSVEASAEALTGPTTPEGARVQLHNPPGSEVGPGQIATWGVGLRQRAEAFGFHVDLSGVSSKHIPFSWSGPSA